MPIVALLMIAYSFYFSITKISEADMTATAERHEAQKAMSSWWRKHRVAAVLVYAAILATVYLHNTLALSILMMLSMVASSLYVGLLGKWGLANRRRVALVYFFLFMFAAQILQPLGRILHGREAFYLDQAWIPLIFGFGAAFCAFLSPVANSLERTRRTLMIGIAIVMGYITGGSAILPSVTKFEDLTTECSEFDNRGFSIRDWNSWGYVSQWVQSQGSDIDFSEASRLIEEEISASKLHPAYELGIVTRFDVLETNRLKELLTQHASYNVEQLFLDKNSEKKISHLGQDEWIIRSLVQIGDLTTSQFDQLESRLLATWPKEITWNAIKEMALVAVLLDVIERPISVETYRPSVHTRLEDLWVNEGELFQATGGFAPDRSVKLESYSDMRSTVSAVDLMAKFGAPAGVDLRQVRSFLYAEVRPNSLFMGKSWSKLRAAAALGRLDKEVGYPPVSWIQFLVAERFFVSAVLMVLLAIYAILKTSNLGPQLRIKYGKPVFED